MYLDLLYAFVSGPASGRDIEVQKVNERKQQAAVDSFLGGLVGLLGDSLHPLLTYIQPTT